MLDAYVIAKAIMPTAWAGESGRSASFNVDCSRVWVYWRWVTLSVGHGAGSTFLCRVLRNGRFLFFSMRRGRCKGRNPGDVLFITEPSWPLFPFGVRESDGQQSLDSPKIEIGRV